MEKQTEETIIRLADEIKSRKGNNELRLLSVKELAKKLNVPTSWIYVKVNNGEIPFFKLGKYIRFIESEIREWLKSKRKGQEERRA